MIICILYALFSESVTAQFSQYIDIDSGDQGITVIDSFADETGYYIFYPSSQSSHIDVVVFTHGYGALNPMIYGGWIAHLVASGSAVIFPRYQMGLLSTSTEDFVPNVAAAIRSAMSVLEKSELNIDASGLHLIGHSYGGVISGNLAVNYAVFGLPAVKSVLLCEPGSGPFTGGVLDTYTDMPSDVILAIVVGDKDRTVGQQMGLNIFESAVNTQQRALFWQFEDSSGDENIGASHYEPYSYDTRFDNGISNFTVSRAESLSRTDWVDYHGYWEIFDTILKIQCEAQTEFDRLTVEHLAGLGRWSNGDSVRRMDVRFPEMLGK